MNWIENIILTEDITQSIEEKLTIINEHLKTNFTASTPFMEVFEALSKEWDSLNVPSSNLSERTMI